jgi:hypothetical protein
MLLLARVPGESVSNQPHITARLVARSRRPEPVNMRRQCMVIFLGGEAWTYQSQLLPQGPVNPECHVEILVWQGSAEATF